MSSNGAVLGGDLPQSSITDKPEIIIDGSGFRLRWIYYGLEATLNRFDAKASGVTCEVELWDRGHIKPGLLYQARMNLMRPGDKREAVQQLNIRDESIDWLAILQQLCYAGSRAYREGEPPLHLGEILYGDTARFLIEPYVGERGATILFGDGSAGKSTLALALAISISSGVALLGRMIGEPVPVLYLDWEDEPEVHAERFYALIRGSGKFSDVPPVYYRRMVAPLHESIEMVHQQCEELGIGAVVVDSLVGARGGEPESAEVTARMFAVARQLRRPWIGVDHITKSGGHTASGNIRPFGSTFTHNLARITYFADRVQELGVSEAVVALSNHKNNGYHLVKRRGIRMTYKMDADERLLEQIVLRGTDLAEIPEHEQRMSDAERIMHALKRGGLTLEAMAVALDRPQAALRGKCSELIKRGSVFLQDGVYKLPEFRRAP